MENLKQQFEGNVSQMLPESVILEKEVNEFDGLFLTLSLIYNDIKTIHLLSTIIGDNIEPPETLPEGVSYHKGEYSGIYVYLIRMLLGTANEFLVFLGRNKKLIEGEDFQKILNKVEPSALEAWNELYKLAISGEKSREPAFALLADIRNDISFHYYGCPTHLPKGFKKFFYEDEKKPQNKRAYYSLGSNMRSSRFFYADAAAEAYLLLKASRHGYSDDDFKNKIFSDLVDKMNTSLRMLIESYIKGKKSKK